MAEEIGIGINLIETEAGGGDFNVDILAQEENTDRRIIIENQLEKTFLLKYLAATIAKATIPNAAAA